MLVVDGLHAAADDRYPECRDVERIRSTIMGVENWSEQLRSDSGRPRTANNNLVFTNVSLGQISAWL